MEPFKNRINDDVVYELASWLSAARPGWSAGGFVEQATGGLDDLELKARVEQVATALHDHLDPDYPTALAHLLDALPPALAGEEGLTDAFGIWPLCTFVEKFGLDHPDLSIPALRQLTRRFSAEFAVRPFIEADPDGMMEVLHRWAEDDDVHVRRLASEGSRPRLPWGQRLRCLDGNPAPLFPLLEKLRDDPSEYVRRSVANNLNDISKDRPDLLVETLQSWVDPDNPDRTRLISHALRTLVKMGHPGALALLGYGPPELAETTLTLPTDQVRLGEHIDIHITLQSASDSTQPLIIDYAVHHQKANGSLSPKVFKWTKRDLAADSPLALKKKHSLKPVTTRRYHAGLHRVELLVNGVSLATADFELVMP